MASLDSGVGGHYRSAVPIRLRGNRKRDYCPMKRTIAYREGYKYQLAEQYAILLPFNAPYAVREHEFLMITGDNYLVIQPGYAWDGPSGPTVDTKSFMRGSLVHDALYQLMRDGILSAQLYRKDADELLKKICLEDGMSAIRAWWVYKGVRFGGEASTKPRSNEVISAP